MKSHNKFTYLILCLVMIVSCLFVVSGCNNNPPPPQEDQYSEWTTTLEPTCISTGIRQRKNLTTGKTETEVVSKTEHIVVNQNAVSATENRAGRTAGSYCSYCQLTYSEPTIVFATGYNNPELYDSNFAYKELGKLSNGLRMQQFYNKLDTKADEFHKNTTKNLNSNVVFEVDFAECNLTELNALKVWSAYKADNPLYYWISSQVAVSGTKLQVLTDDEYKQASVRNEHTNNIYNAVKVISAKISAETNTYATTLAFHDAIVKNMEYAYIAGTNNPETASWAHNVLGFVENSKGVCESYAKTFQLLLNFSGIENTVVAGTSNSQNHMWNIVNLGDNNWYWYDLTWDDGDKAFGTKYNYFCVNDTQNVTWLDGGLRADEQDFLDSHTIFGDSDNIATYWYNIPARATEVYSSQSLEHRETFNVRGIEYAIVGFNEVQVTKVETTGTVNIPEYVKNNGVKYEVVSIGGFESGKNTFDSSTIFPDGQSAKILTLPKTIKFIWDHALSGMDIETINVDENNPYFKSVDGILYTKNLFTLISYPRAKTATEYVMPEQTYYVADGAFVFMEHLSKITISKNMNRSTVPNWGNGYPTNESEVKNIISNNLIAGISARLVGDKQIVIPDGHKYYCVDGGFVKNLQKTMIYALAGKEDNVVIPEGIQLIADEAFMNQTLVSVSLPSTLTLIGNHAFANNHNLKTIYNNSSLVLTKGSTEHGQVALYAETIE